MEIRDMKASRIVVLAAIFVGLSAVAARFAYAIAGAQETPGAAFAADYPEEAQKLVLAALQRKDCKYLRGYFVNWYTTLHYAGSAESLNLQIDDLLKSPGSSVTVRFKKLQNHGDWLILHDAHANSFQIQINLDSKNINLEKLRLPTAEGPELPGIENS